MGYGVVTDWWAKGTEPTVSCQMHTTQTVCADTGMLASPYCPNPVQKGVVTIPPGHPLYNLLGTKYQQVIEEYLGTAVSTNTTCTWHNEENKGQVASPGATQQFGDAQQLIDRAEQMLAGMNPTEPQYQAIRNAADYLRMLIGGNSPDQQAVMGAMTTLMQAMAGIY